MDSGSFTIAIIVIMLVAVSVQIALELIRRSQFKKLRSAMLEGRFDDFDQRIEGRLCRLALPADTREHLKLNACLMQDDVEKVTAQFDRMLARRTGKKARRDLVAKAYNFFVMQRDRERSERLLDEIRTWHEGSFEEGCVQLFDILILGKADYIDTMRDALDAANDEQRGYLEYLISEQYQNLGDQKQAEAYRKRSKRHMGKAAKAK